MKHNLNSAAWGLYFIVSSSVTMDGGASVNGIHDVLLGGRNYKI